MYPIICAPDNEFPFVITPTVCHCCARWDCVMGSRMWCTIRRNQWAPAKTCKQCVKVQLQTVLLKCYRRLLLFFIQADPRAYYYLTKLHIKQTSVLCFSPLPKSSPSSAMRKASVNSLALSFSSIWHFVFVSSGQHFSTTPMSKTLFFMPLTSLCFNLSLHVGHLDGR